MNIDQPKKTRKKMLYLQFSKDPFYSDEQILNRSRELLQDPETVRKQVAAVEEDANFPGHVAVREWNVCLSDDEMRRLNTFLSCAARLGKISQGYKRSRRKSSGRSVWCHTYLPEVIAAASEKLFPGRTQEG
jgi:hypothetical protein